MAIPPNPFFDSAPLPPKIVEKIKFDPVGSSSLKGYIVSQAAGETVRTADCYR